MDAGVQQFLELTNQYGLPLIALAVVIAWIKPKIDKTFDIALGLRDKEKKDLGTLPARLITVMEINEQVMDLLRAIISEFECSRAYVYTYHNGGHSINGLEFAKVSCTHEAVSLGTKPQQRYLQNLPVTMICAFNRSVLDGTGIKCEDVSCFKDTYPSTYETLSAQGVRSVYCVGLYTASGTPVGFIGLDYCGDKFKMPSEQFDELESLSARIATMLCIADSPICSYTRMEDFI